MDNIISQINPNAATPAVAATTSVHEELADQYGHLSEPYRSEAALSDAARIELVKRGVVIEHPAYKLATDYAHWILSQPPGTPGKGMLLMGQPGVGKSTFGEELVRSGKGRIVMINAEGARSMRELYGRVLQSFDGPVARSMHTPDRELAVIRLFKAFNVRGFAVDEIQDLTKGSQREHQQVLMGIKYLSNVARIPLFCLGTPDAAKAFYVEKGLEKRLRPFTLPQWKLDQSFADLIKAVEQTLPLRKPSAIRNEATLRYLLEISGGSLREIIACITCASVRAILSGEEALTLQGLKDAEWAPPRDGDTP
jgi:hypothetical protein